MTHKEFCKRGGKASAAKMTPEERKARARKAILARWDAVRFDRICKANPSTVGLPGHEAKRGY